MTPLPHAEDRHLRRLRGLALATVLLMAVVVVASAWLRLAQPRPTCLDWPGCRSAQVPATRVAADATLGAPAVLAATRAVHRLAASTLLLVVLVLVVLAARTGPGAPRAASLLARAVTMLALALGLAALGVVTPGARSSVVMLGNLIGGLLLFALSWATWLGLHGAHGTAGQDSALVSRARGVALLWLLQVALGARSGAGGDDVAPVAHLALALLAAPSAFAIGLLARRQGRRAEGAGLMTLVLLQLLVGAAAGSLSAAPALVLAHNATAALALALLVGLGLGRRR
jgi:heme A synthase